MTQALVVAHQWAASDGRLAETQLLTKIVLGTFLTTLWVTGWLCGWFCRRWWQEQGPPRLCPRGVRAMVDKVKLGYAGWASWWNTKTPTPQEEWVEAVRRAAETPSDIGDRADTPVRRTSTSTPTEEAREERRTREEPRPIERDWWDFPSPSGRRSRWLASSANQGVLEVMAAAASPILRSRVNPPWTERSPTGGDRWRRCWVESWVWMNGKSRARLSARNSWRSTRHCRGTRRGDKWWRYSNKSKANLYCRWTRKNWQWPHQF